MLTGIQAKVENVIFQISRDDEVTVTVWLIFPTDKVMKLDSLDWLDKFSTTYMWMKAVQSCDVVQMIARISVSQNF